MENLLKDIRFALKLLLKGRGFTAAALLTLALCIGANTAMFSVVDSILLRPLPFAQPDRLVNIYNGYPRAGVERASNSVPDLFDRRELPVFTDVALYQNRGLTIGEERRPERVLGQAVTPSLFPMLGIAPALGRVFTPEEGELGEDHRVILSHAHWQEQFGGRPDVLGSTVRINELPHTIVGVMPPGFRFGSPEIRLWVPLAFSADQRSDQARHGNSWDMLARLAPGQSVASAQAQIDALNARLDTRFPEFSELLKGAGYHTVVRDFREELTHEVRDTLWLLQAGVLLVLLIGCVNIANLMLVRATSRHRELATRSALGAGRFRLVRQLLTESVVLALAGGALGVLLGYAGVHAFATFAAEHLPRGAELSFDVRTLLVAGGVTLTAGLLFGAIPVIRLIGADLSAVFRDEGRTGTSGRGTRAWRSSLVVAQVAIAFALLSGAGLLLASFARTLRIDPGLEAENLLTASVSLPFSRYQEEEARQRFAAQLLERVRALPGVQHAAVTDVLPFGNDYNSSAVTVEGQVVVPGESIIAPVNSLVSDGYFEAMGIEVVAGRGFTAADREDAVPVAVVDRELAEHFYPGQDPLGRRISQGVAGIGRDDELEYRTIVGVVENVRVRNLSGDQPPGHLYMPFAQQPNFRIFLAVRSAGSATSLTGGLRAALAETDAELPLFDVQTMTERMSESLTQERARMVLLIGFAAIALFLAAVGLYGVLAYSVAQRSAEIGIRLALGSSTRQVFRMVLGQGGLLVLLGLAIGGVGSLALARVVQSMLVGVTPGEPAVYGAVLVLLGLTALVACTVPALRAARLDPLVAIRETT